MTRRTQDRDALEACVQGNCGDARSDRVQPAKA